MPKGKPLTKELRERIYDLYTMGVPQADIAKQFDIHSNTVSRVVSTQRKLREGKRVEKVSEVVVAGDKRNGRLVSVGTNRFEGSCLVAGKMKRRTFTAINARNAQQQWEKWCTTLLDEQSFMDMVERKGEEPKVACGYPGDPIEEIRPTKGASGEGPFVPADEPLDMEIRSWREVAEEREQEIERLKAELEEAKTQRIEFAEGFQMEEHNPTYLIWTKQPEVRLYGLYLTMDAAFKEVDRLNDVAKFLGQDGVFEVEEVAWRG